MKLLGVTIFILAAARIWAAEPAKGLTLSEAIRRGLTYSLEFQKAESAKKQADAEYRIARSKILPTISLNASEFGVDNTDRTRPNYSHLYKASLDAEQPLFAAGALTSGMKAANLRRQVAEQKLRAVRQDYLFKIVNAYYQAAQAQVLLTLARDNRTVLKNYFDITTRYAAIGRSKGIDRLQAEASYNLSESQVLEAESSAEDAKQSLARLIGDEDGLNAELSPRLSFEANDFGSIDKLLNQALKDNPELQSLASQVESVTYENRARMIAYRPTVSLKGSWGYDALNNFDQFLHAPTETWNVGVVLKIPLFSGLGGLATSDQLAEQRVQAEKDLAIRRQDLKKTLSTALATLQRDFSRLKLTRVSADSSKKAMDVAVRDYRNGLLSSTDVLNIQRTRFDADRQYTLAQYSYNQQMLNLRRDLGLDLMQIYEGR